MAVKIITIWGLTAIATMLIAGVVAAIKNRDVSFWMGWSFIIPPMAIALVLLPALAQRRRRARIRISDDDDSPD